ncbi:uncharacterized protein METZ01_LOCUS88915 [marine metagenome]|uniref:Uncharacterized protein n=1 Tax=marine metagenome TaxID=408172 RepID=A0A381V7R8_9ZZZZ
MPIRDPSKLEKNLREAHNLIGEFLDLIGIYIWI